MEMSETRFYKISSGLKSERRLIETSIFCIDVMCENLHIFYPLIRIVKLRMYNKDEHEKKPISAVNGQ